MESKLDHAFKSLGKAHHEAIAQVGHLQEACAALHNENVDLKERIERALQHLEVGATGLAIQALRHRLPK